MDLTFQSVFEAGKANLENQALNGLNVLLGNATKPAPPPVTPATNSTVAPGNSDSGPFEDGAGGAGFPSNASTLNYQKLALYGLGAIAVLAIAYVIVRK